MMDILSEIRRERGLAKLCCGGTAVMTVRQKDLETHPLRAGEPFDPEAYARLLAPDQFADAWEAALSMLDRSAKTAFQVQTSLARKGFVPDAVDAVLRRLAETRLIDDALYARRMAEAAARTGMGRFVLRQKMRTRGIPEPEIEAALELLDDDGQAIAARALARKLAPRYAADPPAKARAKLSQALARRGYSWEIISAALGDAFEEDDPMEE